MFTKGLAKPNVHPYFGWLIWFVPLPISYPETLLANNYYCYEARGFTGKDKKTNGWILIKLNAWIITVFSKLSWGNSQWFVIIVKQDKYRLQEIRNINQL